MLPISEPKTCCLWFSPRTGTLLLGWLGVFGAVFGIISNIKLANMDKESILEVCKQRMPNTDSEKCYHLLKRGWMFGSSEEVFRLFICALLIAGVMRRSPILMIPFMIIQGLAVVLVSMLVLAMGIGLAVNGNWGLSITATIIGGLFVAIASHFFLVVQACYKQITEENKTRYHRQENIEAHIEAEPLPHSDPPPPYSDPPFSDPPPPYKLVA